MEYVTEAVLEDFCGTGIQTLAPFLEGQYSNEDEKLLVLSTIYTECLVCYEAELITEEALLQFFPTVITDDLHAVCLCQVFDSFNLPDSLPLVHLLSLLVRKNVLKQSTIAQQISTHLVLGQLGVVNKDSFHKQLNIHKRDQFYTQRKYNLLHEEVVGYAKYIYELSCIMQSTDCEYQVDYAHDIILSLIGHYQLDPNRCLDLLLGLYCNYFINSPEFCIKLLKKSQWWPKLPAQTGKGFDALTIGGNSNAAKIVSLTLTKHQKDKDLTETYRILIACLIKEGFISLGQLYPHLSRDDDDMAVIESQFKKELDDQVFRASASALALAAPLIEEDEASSENSGNGTQLSEVKENGSGIGSKKQSIGDKLAYNFKFQFLRVFLGNGLYWPSIYILTENPFLVHVDPEIPHLINRLIAIMIGPLYAKVQSFSKTQLCQLSSLKKAPSSKVNADASQFVHLYSFKPTIRDFAYKKFHYIYKDWSKDLPVIKTVEDLFVHLEELFKFLGVHLAQDVELFIRLCEIGDWDLSSPDITKERKTSWLQFFRRFLFPAMGTIEENAIAIDKAYAILKHYSLEDRFNLYGELHQVLSKSNAYIKLAYNKAEKATKDVLKRLSKENVPSMMRRLAKISFSNPLPCFLTVLQQIESYDNLNTLVVETARYFNSYGWDVLTLALLMRLTAAGRSTVQSDGLFDRQWIQSLASFIGKICHRYPLAIDLTTLFKFLLKSLHNQETIAFIILKEILNAMGGIQPISNLTFIQVTMLNSGSSVQKITLQTIMDSRFDRSKSGNILIHTLQDLDAINELFILLCKFNQSYIYQSDDAAHLKVMSNRSDELEMLIHSYITFVHFFGAKSNIMSYLTPMGQMFLSYHLESKWIWELWRQYLPSTKPLEEETALEIRNSIFDALGSSMSFDLYLTFWKLSLYDINYDSSVYEKSTEKLESSLVTHKASLAQAKRSTTKESRVRVDELKSEIESTELKIELVAVDKQKHQAHSEIVLSSFKSTFSNWFTADNHFDSQMNEFLLHCILPRSIHSSFDAVFSARFILTLNNIQSPNFSLISCLEKLFNSRYLFGTLYTLTSTEAENLGLFYATLLTQLHDWKSENAFTSTVLKNSDGDQISLPEFGRILYLHHESLQTEIISSLKANEFTCVNNVITFLKNLLGIFPVIEDHCELVVDTIERLIKRESRQDLVLALSALVGHIKARTKERVHMWDFYEMDPKEKQEQIDSREKIQNSIKEAQLKAQREQEEQAKEREREERARLAKEKAATETKMANIYDEKLPKAIPAGPSSSRGSDIRSGTDTPTRRYDYYSKYNEDKKSQKDGMDKVTHEKSMSAGPEKGLEVQKVKTAELSEGSKSTTPAPVKPKISNIPSQPKSQSETSSSPEKIQKKLSDLKNNILEKRMTPENRKKANEQSSTTSPPPPPPPPPLVPSLQLGSTQSKKREFSSLDRSKANETRPTRTDRPLAQPRSNNYSINSKSEGGAGFRERDREWGRDRDRDRERDVYAARNKYNANSNSNTSFVNGGSRDRRPESERNRGFASQAPLGSQMRNSRPTNSQLSKPTGLSRANSLSLPPPPPPPPPPASSSQSKQGTQLNRGRYDAKRKYDNFEQERSYKKPRY